LTGYYSEGGEDGEDDPGDADDEHGDHDMNALTTRKKAGTFSFHPALQTLAT